MPIYGDTDASENIIIVDWKIGNLARRKVIFDKRRFWYEPLAIIQPLSSFGNFVYFFFSHGVPNVGNVRPVLPR